MFRTNYSFIIRATVYCTASHSTIGTLYSGRDDERVIRSKHVKQKPWNKKIIRIVHLAGHLHIANFKV